MNLIVKFKLIIHILLKLEWSYLYWGNNSKPLLLTTSVDLQSIRKLSKESAYPARSPVIEITKVFLFLFVGWMM